jgi:hypothetical protein
MSKYLFRLSAPIVALCLFAPPLLSADLTYRGPIRPLIGELNLSLTPGFMATCNGEITLKDQDGKGLSEKRTGYSAVESRDQMVWWHYWGYFNGGRLDIEVPIDRSGRAGEVVFRTTGRRLTDDERWSMEFDHRAMAFLLTFSGRRVHQAGRMYDDADLNSFAEGLINTMGHFANEAVSLTKRGIFNDHLARGLTTIDKKDNMVSSGQISIAYLVNGKPFSYDADGYLVIDLASGLTREMEVVATLSIGDFRAAGSQRMVCEITGAPTLATGPPVSYPATDAPATAKSSMPSTTESIRQRLEALDDLLKRGLVGKEEAAEKRREILKGL